MEQTLVIIKPSAVQRGLIGEVTARFERKGIMICGLKMMQLDENILREHYAHLVNRPFFPLILRSMMATPVVVMCLKGKDVVQVVRAMAGATNARNAAPGTIRGDFGMSSQENIIHASDSPDNGVIETNRFFRPEELFDYRPACLPFTYSEEEVPGVSGGKPHLTIPAR